MLNGMYPEKHFYRFRSGGRTNIYGLSVVSIPISSSSSDANSADYANDEYTQLFPKTKNLVFVSAFQSVVCLINASNHWKVVELPIGEDGEIVSLTAFTTNQTNLFLVLTVVNPKMKIEVDDEVIHDFALRIYSCQDILSDDGLVRLMRNVQVIKIDFTPTQVIYTTFEKRGQPLDCIIVCGFDGTIHLYTETSRGKWDEEREQVYFPLLRELAIDRTSITALEIRDINNKIIIAAGCNNGLLHLAIMERDASTGLITTRVDLNASSIDLSSLISSMVVFQSSSSKGDIHLVVTCAIERAIIFRSIDKKGLSSPFYLPESTQYDSVLCAHVADVDWDAKKEVLIGTYGRQLLIYKESVNEDNELEYYLASKHSYPHPIYGIQTVDLKEDYMCELIVNTQYGIHVEEPNGEVFNARLIELAREFNTTTEPTEPPDPTESIDADPAESIASADPAEPPEPTESTELPSPTDPTDPTESIRLQDDNEVSIEQES
ncbi:4019_t:CDS:10 [Paraglomus occultum]|uniref:4019_t:CDS:1 n=1 Tax=Paraglomus occultum TaxID=144539 RepID=A0A9N9BK58_9GLOM|nr:4019_t:CDS:10 [Paraglomus occultum]